jgi:hypothetical protein
MLLWLILQAPLDVNASGEKPSNPGKHLMGQEANYWKVSIPKLIWQETSGHPEPG